MSTSSSPGPAKVKPDQPLGLSTISKMYDTANKGYLDENEQKMREMDTANRGHLTNAQVYDMMTEMYGKIVTMRKLVLGLGVFAVLLSLANVGTAFAAARLAKDTTVDSNSATLMIKDGSEMVGTKALAGMQVSVSNGCADIEKLAKAYNTVKSGSTVSMVSTTSAPGTREDINGDGLIVLEEGDDDNGFAIISQRTDAVSDVSLTSDKLCVGSACFALGTPCGGDGTEETGANIRRLERASLQRELFLQVVNGRSPSRGSLRNTISRRLYPSCCRDINRRCTAWCNTCKECVHEPKA